MELKPTQPKFIVLDSTVFIADYWLRSPSFVLLRDFLNKTSATLVVPEVVFEEVVNHHKEDITKVRSNIRTALREAGRLIRNFWGAREMDSWRSPSRTPLDPYHKFLASELGALNAKIPSYSEIPHEEIVKRDLQRRRPFQQSGKGYRDTLLWETMESRKCIEKRHGHSFRHPKRSGLLCDSDEEST